MLCLDTPNDDALVERMVPDSESNVNPVGKLGVTSSV